METITRELYNADRYSDSETFNQVMRDIAEHYVEIDFYGSQHVDYESAVQHEMSIMDHWTVWEHINDYLRIEFSDALDALELGLDGDYVLASGTLGLWDGQHETFETFEDAREALQSILDGGCELETIIVTDESVQVVGVHHDGRNVFELRAIPDTTWDALESWKFGEGPFGYLGCQTMLHRVKLNPYWSRPILAVND